MKIKFKAKLKQSRQFESDLAVRVLISASPLQISIFLQILILLPL